MKKFKHLLIILIGIVLIHMILISLDGLTSKPEKSEFAVIFGNTVHPDGSLSERLKARVDKGLKLYQDSLVKQLFVSGGFGKEGHNEALKMADYLVEKGVPKQVIVIDDKGYNSWETASNFRKMQPNCTSVIVVSQFYHISRSKMAFRKIGVVRVSGTAPLYFEWRDFYSLFREFFGYYKYLIAY